MSQLIYLPSLLLLFSLKSELTEKNWVLRNTVKNQTPWVRQLKAKEIDPVIVTHILKMLPECGIPSARGASSSKGVEGLLRSAHPGDWPWHAALLRTHVHACDAALIHPSWLVTTASCFQVRTSNSVL